MSQDFDIRSSYVQTSPNFSVQMSLSPNKSSFSDKYLSLFNSVVKPTTPENTYWNKYKERTERYYKKQNTDLDIKAMQFKLEQDKLNYKKDFPFTQRSNNSGQALVNLKKSLEKKEIKNYGDFTKKTRNYYYKKDLLKMLNIPEKEENMYNYTFIKQSKGFDQDRYPNAFVKKIKKTFPEFIKDGFVQKTFCLDKSDNLKFAKMKKEINKIFS